MIVSPRLHSLLPLRPFGYALLITLAMLVLHQGPVLAYALGQIDLSTRDGWMILAALELVQAVPGILVLTLAGMLSPWLMKILAAALLIGNAVARHFMVTYGIVIDPTMIGNILNTDSAETGALINLPMLAGIALWGVLPAALAVWLPVQRGRLLRMAGALALVLAVFVGGVYAVSGVWLWFDQHNSRLGPRILPWGYLGNVARYGAEYQRRNRPVHPLPDATLSPLPGPRTIVVLVIVFILWLKLGRRSRRYGSRGGKRRQRRAYRGRRRW